MIVYKQKIYNFICIIVVSFYAESKRVKRSGWFGTKPPNAKCLFDMCTSVGYCQNGGTCTMNEETCMSTCECPASHTGPRCGTSLLTLSPSDQQYSSTMPTTRSMEDRKCYDGFICDHGFCNMASGAFSCVCDPHWGGRKCDQFVCDLTCASGSKCERRSDVPVCVQLSTTEVPSTQSSSTDLYTLRPIEERTCLPTFVCIQGRCDRDTTPGFRCECDDTWGGLFCDKSLCPAECPNTCVYQNNQHVCSDSDGESTISIVPTTEIVIQSACDANYTKRPVEDRRCAALTCEYGYCRVDNKTIRIGHQDHVTKVFACVCDEHAVGFECESQCCLDCGENGRCQLDNNSQPFCMCVTNRFYGPTCNLTRTGPEPQYLRETWYMWVVGVCAFVLLILILTLVVLPYMMWRNRVTLIMKIVHYFQPYEDNDERKWDAFVAFRSGGSDEHFVLRTLRPKLEEELGFSLCLHFRDFIPGETIANNIIEAIDSSRRTILIISPRFVESEFLQFEYQIAQERMLKRKQRLIPIIIEDISSITSSTDPNLKQILKSVTYIEWPEESNEKKQKTFWRRLELSMPKRKSLEEKQKALKDSSTERSSNTYSVITKESKVNGRQENGISSSNSNSQIKIITHDNITFEFEKEKKFEEKNENDLNVHIEKYMIENSKC